MHAVRSVGRTRPGRAKLLLCAVALAACSAPKPSPAPDPARLAEAPAPRCSAYAPERELFWGDLHVHTGLSSDAWRSDVRGTPDDAYRYATGGEISLAPLDAAGEGTRRVRLARPLDFAAVTDHAEALGILALCGDPKNDAYASQACDYFRRLPPTPAFPRPPDVPPRSEVQRMACGDDGARCRAAQHVPWETTRAAAERWNDDTPACRFSTFIAYEWTGARGGPLLHRNVIFRNARSALPVSSNEEPTPWDLFHQLRVDCLEAGNGCDVLSIPHNGNTSQGRMFAPDYPGADDPAAEARLARLRAALEPSIEIMQHKGDSECRNGLSGMLGEADELCEFEKLFPAALPECTPDTDVTIGTVRCTDVGGYARGGLGIGLQERARLGVNPFQFGFIASTDTHNATPGQVEEAGWEGHVGLRDDRPATRMGRAGQLPNTINNPGGLAAVWAEENSRESLFQAIRRRETYGTSGPRMRVRLFGGWDLPEDLCERDDFVATGYARGVPMGGVLPDAPADAAPTFALRALRDPGSEAAPGNRLQRTQIIKLTTADGGRIRQQVFDVAGDADNGADVDPATCAPRGPGADALCAVWRDPDFDPSRDAVYYARVVENPSCRWHVRECLTLPASQRPAECSGSALPDTVQERAWTSPIWFETAGR